MSITARATETRLCGRKENSRGWEKCSWKCRTTWTRLSFIRNTWTYCRGQPRARRIRPEARKPLARVNREARGDMLSFGRHRPSSLSDTEMDIEHNQHLEITDSQGNRIVPSHGVSSNVIAVLGGESLAPNRGTSLNLDWVENVRVNTSAVERRAATLVTRRTVKKDWQIAWMLRAITCMDLTTLSGDDTDERVRRLCAKAQHPIRQEIVEKLGIESLNIQVGAVCVYHLFVETAKRALQGSKIPVAAVSTGFPAGLSPLEERINEIRRSVEAGADEIDVVITRAHVFGG